MSAGARGASRTPSRVQRESAIVRAFACTAVWCGAALLCSFWTSGAAAAGAKQYTMPSVTITAVVAEDGSMLVTELRRFRFQGDFSRVSWELDPRGSEGIEVLGVVGPDGPLRLLEGPSRTGFYTVHEGPRLVRVTAFLALRDATADLILRYRVSGAAVPYADTAELRWQFIGRRWSEGTGLVTVDLRLPKGAADDAVRAWAHGPPTVDVRRTAEGVRLTAPSLPPNEVVDLRALFPAGALSSAPVIYVPRRESVLMEERRLADEASARRAADSLEQARREALVLTLGLAAPTAAALLLVLLYFTHGRGFRVRGSRRPSLDIPGELSPAHVTLLWDEHRLFDAGISATLLDLVRRGVLSLQPVAGDAPGWSADAPSYGLARRSATKDEPAAHELILLDLLFHDVSDMHFVTIGQIERFARRDPGRLGVRLLQFRQAVIDHGGAELTERQSKGATVLAVGTGIVAAACSVAAGIIADQPLWLLGVAAAAAVVWLALHTLRRPSAAAVELYGQYRRLYVFMRDAGRMGMKPPVSLVLWERYLVLATVFGLADDVREGLCFHLPEVAEVGGGLGDLGLDGQRLDVAWHDVEREWRAAYYITSRG